jgi:lipoprotein-releasing system ATP-binding protein
VLRGVDFAVEAGEMVALLGASGAGKSTLLHVLGLLDAPTSGEVLFDGKPVHDLSLRAKAKLRHQAIGFVFQFYHLIPELTALQNVLLGEMMLRGPMTYWSERIGIRARAMALLTEVGLGQRLDHRPAELSGGEKQRVAIARALIAQPRVILADEPTGNLDSATADGVLQLLFRINRERGIAFVLVTHNEELAARCDRIVRLRDGKVLGSAS